tara:strand:- start:629 stop:817 length:189 start_codon:yes stop_codon:yes gene_type:complete
MGTGTLLVVQWSCIIFALLFVLEMVRCVALALWDCEKMKREAKHREIKSEKYTYRRKKKGMN